jgi:acyl-CoA synthetase (AMP-forming)/AMP-acid ligase II
MLISRGENVYSIEVENVMASHPAVAKVCGHRRSQRRLRWSRACGRAAQARRENRGTDIMFCKKRIVHYKWLCTVDIRHEQLPLSGPAGFSRATCVRHSGEAESGGSVEQSQLRSGLPPRRRTQVNAPRREILS